jgi:hypothetical protein
MISINKMRDMLLEGFPEPQADLMARVFVTAHDELVTKAEFNELTAATRELAEAQVRTEHHMDDLAQAQQRTESRVEELAESQNRTDHHLKELAEAQNRTDHHLKELAEAQNRTDHHLKELAEAQKRTECRVEELAEAQNRTDHHLKELAEAQKRTECRVEELSEAQNRTDHHLNELAEAQERTDHHVEELAKGQDELRKSQQRTEWALRDLAKQVGGLSNALGGSLEEFACELVAEMLEKYWQMEVASAGPEELLIGRRQREIDVVVRGTVAGKPVVVLCEVKATVTAKEVSGFLTLTDRFRAANPADDIRPLFFGYKANRAARERILASGAAMVFSRGVMIPVA